MAAARKSVSDTFRMNMRPNLSIERLAVTLAALGTTAVVAACSRAEPPSVRPEQTPAASVAPPPPQAMPDETKKSEGENEPAPTTVATATASARPIAQPRRHVGPGGDKGTGQASCGAGTCTADPKKK
jgi:hypothetical protein